MFLMDIHAGDWLGMRLSNFVGVYIFYILYIYYHGIVDHSGINFKVIWIYYQLNHHHHNYHYHRKHDHHCQALWFQPWQPDCIFHDNHHQVSLWSNKDNVCGAQNFTWNIQFRKYIFFGISTRNFSPVFPRKLWVQCYALGSFAWHSAAKGQNLQVMQWWWWWQFTWIMVMII